MLRYLMMIFKFELLIWIAVITSAPLLLMYILFYCAIDDYQRIYKNVNNSMKIVCYYNFPETKTDLQPEDIIPDLCTHINLAFFGINQTDFSITTSPKNLQIIPRLTKLQEESNDLKIIISIGGAGNDNFSKMVKTHSNRKMFINSTMRFLKKFKLDGVDIDWEWPCKNGNIKEKVKFIQLLQEIRTEFDRHKKHYILSAAVGAVKSQINIFYYTQYIPKYVDYINLMTYDYHFYSSFYPLTDYNAPLYSSMKDNNSVFSELNINFSVNYWISQSMPLKKIIMGVPTFGHTYRLISSLNHGLHAPTNGFGLVGENGYILYYETCAFLKLLNTFKVVDDHSLVPYAYNEYDWVSYDDEESVRIKAEYILEMKLGGAMIYALNSDDFAGTCRKDQTKFPLTKKVKSVFSSTSPNV